MSTVRVIAVEDERLVARELKLRLSSLGYEVPAIASSAEQAIQLVHDMRPNILLMDIRLEGERDGIEAAKIVRDRFGVPVIFVTAHADSDTLERASGAEPFGFILKPFDDRELKATIDLALYKHKTEMRLRQAQERLLRAHRIAQLGDWEQDLASGDFLVSKEAGRILGIECGDDQIMSADRLFAMVYPEDAPEVRQAFRKSAADRTPLRIEHRIVSPGQRERFVRHYGEVVTGDAGAPARMLGAVQDITVYKDLEERLRRAQRLEAIGRLAGGVAHDFNNLLVAIKGYSDLILSELHPNDPLFGPMEQILKAGDRASALTRQLLTFSGSRIMRAEVTDLNKLIRELQKMLRRLVVEEIEIREDLEPSIWPVRADPSQIEQVIMNLVVNARDAMPSGGVLTISTSNVEMGREQLRSLPNLKPGRYVSLSVADTGTGMTAETQRRIFEPFFTTKQPGEGTGLGLSTVYGAARQHGGDVFVDSEVGRGSTFRIYLPAADTGGEPVAAEGERRSKYVGTETVLLVEDDEMVRGLATEMLRQLGYKVVAAGSGEEAIALASAHEGRIDLVLTDVIMPHIGGPDVAEKIAAARPGIKVLFMSGYPGTMTSERGILQDDAHFLQKPFSMAELGRKIRAALDGSPEVGG